MPTPNDSILTQDFIAFLGGDRCAGATVFAQMSAPIFAIVRKRAPDLRANDQEDVLSETFILMMEAPHRFDRTRGSARTFITSVLVPDAIQRVRAKTARPGTTTRRRKSPKSAIEVTFPMQDPIPDPATAQVLGYGSPAAMEAACDAHVIWSRAHPAMRLLIGGLMDGKAQVEVASKLKIDRFKVARLFKTLHSQFVNAA